MNLRTKTTSAADVAAALEVMMPFGHGNRIPKHYIENKTRQLELSSRNQQNTRSESTVTETIINTTKDVQLLVKKIPSGVGENATNSTLIEESEHDENIGDSVNQDSAAEVEDPDIFSINIQRVDADKDSILCNPSLTAEKESLIQTSSDADTRTVDPIDEHENFANGGDKPSLTTEETSSVETLDEMISNKANMDACADYQSVVEDASQSSNADESLDFTISVSMTDDDNENSVVKTENRDVLIEMNSSIEIVDGASVVESEHLSVTETDRTMVLEGCKSVEVIPKIGDRLLRSFDDVQVSSTEDVNNTIAVDSEPEDKKKILEGNEISLIVNDSTSMSNEDKCTFSQSEEKTEIVDMTQDDNDEEYVQSTMARDSFLVKLSLIGGLNDTMYDEFVERVCEHKALIMTLIKRYDVGLLRQVENKSTLRTAYLIREVEMQSPKTVSNDPHKAIKEPDYDVRLDTNFMEHMDRMRALELESFELPDFAHIEQVMERAKLQTRESMEIGKDFQNEEVVETLQPKVANSKLSAIEMRDEDVKVQEESESTEVEGIAETTKPKMLQGSGKSMPKFRAVIESAEDTNDEPPTRIQSPSSSLSRRETPEIVDVVQEPAHKPADVVQEPAHKPAELKSSNLKKYSMRPSSRQTFASTTTLASIRAEVEAKYSRMPRPTAAFDRQKLYNSGSSNPIGTNPVYKAAVVAQARVARIASSYKAPVVRVAPAHRGVPLISQSEDMPEIIDLVNFSEPPVVDLVNFSESLVVSE